ncbi:MAG: ABC transporter permease [Lachnospiraceae bacterium]|nr:ABC transporter permease [Lachnospiraceae bacterium]MDE6186341.1 ABC transporter permease [Lachnospiraceae bacterium]MDE7286804.1 ABC transporter permease [Lachnospiraceae bacterium]
MALKIKDFFKSLSIKQIVFSLIALMSFILYLILTLWSDFKVAHLIDQQAAARWDEEGGSAQVSCFFAERVEVDEYMIMSFEKQLEQSLNEVLSEEDKKGEKGERLFIDAYSSMGTIEVISEKGQLKASAIGVGGDFFLFHPIQLVSGGYFSGSDLMKDAVVLDEDAAWQLFGSSDIAGMTVWIGNVPHHVAGVIKRQEGRFAERAGLDKTIVYVSNETLAEYGTSSGISVYEVTAPNPVKGFVYNCIKEKLGVEETDMVMVENSSRYLKEALIPVILDYGTRSMQISAVRFPYWENIARGWEDVKALILLFQFIFLMIPIIIIAVYVIGKWRHRKWTLKDAGHFLIDVKDQMVLKMKGEKDRWQDF